MKKVLVLGGTRFFGKELVRKLIQKGHEVTIGTRGNNLGEFEGAVENMIIDRQDKASLKKALQGRAFDVVYDNICYSPNEVRNLLEILEGNIGKYIVTSSGSVYEGEGYLKEERFNPYTYPIKDGERADFSYAEGKRLVEAVAFQAFNIPTVAVRFPIVIGKNDYTERLLFFVKNILEGNPMSVRAKKNKMVFITQEEAGAFLYELQDKAFTGPINANCNGVIRIEEIISLIEKKANKKAHLIIDESSEQQDPYSSPEEMVLDNTRARAIGFEFNNVKEEVEKVVSYYIEKHEKSPYQ